MLGGELAEKIQNLANIREPELGALLHFCQKCSLLWAAAYECGTENQWI